MGFFKTRVLLWPVLLIIVLFISGMVAATAFGALNVLALGSLFGASSEQRNSQVVRSIERTEEVALLKLGIEGIIDKTNESKIGDFTIPWSEKTLFLRYSFDAKLGIDGKQVDIEPAGENTYRISIPEFIFIGADNDHVEEAARQNDGLSWTTPEIDGQELRNNILNDEAKAKYIESNAELLQEQAIAFYTNIVHAVAPDADIEFLFDGKPAVRTD